MTTEKEAISKAPSGRVKRVPVGTRNVLTVEGKDPNFHYRIINDQGDRVQEFLDAGYEIVDAKTHRVGDKRAGQATPEGSVSQISLGLGDKGYLVRIKKEWYEEDQAAKQAKVKAIEETTKQKALDGTYGKLEITRS